MPHYRSPPVFSLMLFVSFCSTFNSDAVVSSLG